MGRGNDYRDNKRGRDGYAPDPWAQDRQPSYGERRSSPSYEDRQSRPRSGPALSSGPETQARVKWFNAEKGFGFVELTDGSGEAFLHISAVERAGHSALESGTTLVVKIGQGQRGPQVAEVVSVDASTAEPEAPRAARSGGFASGGFSSGGPRPSGGFRSQGRAVDLSNAREARGTVKWYNAEKGFGFVAADEGGKDLFVHRSALERSGARDLPEGMRVRVKIVEGQKGPEVAEIEPE